MKILTVVGARPQFIKAAVVSRAVASHNARAGLQIEEAILHTGQHYDARMSDVFFNDLSIPEPAVDLGVGSGSHGAQTAKMLAGIEAEILSRKPDWVLLYGDTNSTLAGALAACKLHVPVAHVEAGLRSFNMRMPEEINRILTDRVSTRLYCPTQTAVGHLRAEGCAEEAIREVGDVMYDAALFYGALADERPDLLNSLDLPSGAFILSTVHRAENTDDSSRLSAIVEGWLALAQGHEVVLPLHPRTRAALERSGDLNRLQATPRFHLIEPVGYLEMILLERRANCIVTDSGGVQKEAYFHGTPCVTLRDETEWVETVTMNWNRLVKPLSAQGVVTAVEQALAAQPDGTQRPYGDGRAGEAIVADLLQA
jgi:UDP-GlcNAc3NAcA epimerase